MITAKELRIGNYVRYIGLYDHYPVVKSITENDDDEIDPITITEEWLLKFGFERTYLSQFRSKFTHKDIHCIGYDFSYVIDKSMEGFTWYGRYVKDIKYIHQLQNLYFALTQKELEINTQTQ